MASLCNDATGIPRREGSDLMPTCEAGECGISCPGPCGCGGSGSHCSCACFPETVPLKSYGNAGASTALPDPVVSGAGLVRDQPFDIDFKEAPLVAVASFLVPEDMQLDVCIPVGVAQTAVTRTEAGIGLVDLLRSLGLRLTGQAA